VRWWVLVGLLAACVSGDIQSGEDPRPPRIPLNQTDPRPGLIVVSDPATQLPMTFRVLQIEEPNTEDTLTVRWFVDYFRNPAIQRQSVLPPQPQSPQPTLRPAVEFILTLSMLEPTPPGDPHLVEVIVADRPFDDPGRVPDLNRTLSEGAYADLVSWTVVVKTLAAAKPVRREEPALGGLDLGRWAEDAPGSQRPLPPALLSGGAPEGELLSPRLRRGQEVVLGR
jgi:hypothetical protein